MVTQYGMSERLGQVTFDAPRAASFLAVPEPAQGATYSEETAKLIDEEIARLVKESHVRVLTTLTEKRTILDALARLLLKHEVVDRATLDNLLNGAAANGQSASSPGSVPVGAA